MSFHLNINESNKKVFIQQYNYIDVDNDIIKIRNAFSENGVYEFYYTGNIVEFTIPTTGTYKIEAWGAKGGGNNNVGPPGAYSKSFVTLNKDERIKILVGEKGYAGSCSYNGAGGGGTFIAKDRTPLCVAGGGGGIGHPGTDSTAQSHACGQSTQLSANFGTGQATLKMGGKGSSWSGGGGGFEGNGGDGTEWGKGGNSFVSGGARQTLGTASSSSYANGGFGGGGSHHLNCGSPAGGGGYTGGSASNSNPVQGGGGGSYFEGFYNHEVSEAISGCNVSLPTNPGTNGNGFAKLTLLTDKPSATVIKHETFSQCKIFMTWVFFATLLSQ
jgi:hypothetical protein